MRSYIDEVPAKYLDCVLLKEFHPQGPHRGYCICRGLSSVLCAEKGKCKFYAPESDYYIENGSGFVKPRKEKKNDEKIYI